MDFHWQYLILNMGLYRTLLCTFLMCLQRNVSDQNFGRYSPRTVNNTTVSSCWGERLRLVGKRFGSLVKAPWARIKVVFWRKRFILGNTAVHLGSAVQMSNSDARFCHHTELWTASGTRLSDGPFYVQHMLSDCKTHTNVMQNMACKAHSCKRLLRFKPFRAGDRLVNSRHWSSQNMLTFWVDQTIKM